VQIWPFTVSPGSSWRQRFQIPLDAEFVGFRTSPQVERAVSALRVRAVRIVDAGRRLRDGTVRSAASFGSTRVFFQDGDVYPESDGFWVKGKATVRATIMKATTTDESITLNLHSGARPNVVTLATPHWSERVELVPGVIKTVVVPSDRGDPLVSLKVAASSGFVPAEIQPGATDRRLLGCWIEFAR